MVNKKGSVFPRNAIFVLTSIFGIGVLTLLIINPVIEGFVRPGLLNAASDSIRADIEPGYDMVTLGLKLIPYSLFVIGLIYLLIIIFRKERVQQYG